MTTSQLYDFLILINHEDCINDIKNLKNKHRIKLFENEKKATNWLKDQSMEITSSVMNDCISIITKYQKNNLTKSFKNAFFWFVLTNKTVFMEDKGVKVISKVNRNTGEKEVFIKINEKTTRQDLINSWESIIKPAINEIPSSSKKNVNKTKGFITKLKIYKCFLRARKQWGEQRNLFNRLYEAEEIDELLHELPKFPSPESFKKLIEEFHKNYSEMNILSKKELLKPIS